MQMSPTELGHSQNQAGQASTALWVEVLCWAVKKGQEHRMQVSEIRKLRYVSGGGSHSEGWEYK